ncbi:holin [Streptomyces phage Mischief19]|nr:holin [Streptomyces phage Mischief19]
MSHEPLPDKELITMAGANGAKASYLKSLVELVAATYALSFLGLLLADGFDLTNLSALKAAGVAAIPSGLSVVYGALAGFVGNPGSALGVDTRDGSRLSLPRD